MSRTRAISVNNHHHSSFRDQPPPTSLRSRPPRHQFSHRKLKPEDLIGSTIIHWHDSKQSTDSTRWPPRTSLHNNSKAWTDLSSNGHIKKTVSMSTRKVSSQPPHKALRGRIPPLHPPPPPSISISIPVRSFQSYLASLIDHDNPTAEYIYTLWVYEQFIPYIYSHLQLHMVEILSTFMYYIWFHVVTIIILFCKHWGSHIAFNFLGNWICILWGPEDDSLRVETCSPCIYML
jgi:hypothetical protein